MGWLASPGRVSCLRRPLSALPPAARGIARLGARARALTHTLAAPATFTRYWQPHATPDLPESEARVPAINALVRAIKAHNIPAAMSQLRADAPPPPYAVWQSLWSLVAEGPSPEPVPSLYQRLDTVCEHLTALAQYHARWYPARSIPAMQRQRYLYLLLKRAERLPTQPLAAEALHGEYQRHARALTDAAGDGHWLDGELLGRLVFRLAHIHAWDATRTYLEAYAAHLDRPADLVAAGQPLAAVMSAASHARDASRREDVLALGWHALTLAFTLHLPVKYVHVHALIAQLSVDETHAWIGSWASVPPASQPPLEQQVRRACAVRPAYVYERAAVVQCGRSDPRMALRWIDTEDQVSFDVYGAAVTSLTWWARARFAPSVALHLLLRVLQRLDAAHLAPDEQMYSELTRALDSTVGARPPSLKARRVNEACLRDLEARVPAPDPDAAHHLLRHVTQLVLQGADEHAVRRPHLKLLLRMHVRLRHFALSEQLYQSLRRHYGSVPPRLSDATFTWLWTEAYTRVNSMAFAVQLYQDRVALGLPMPAALVEPFLTTLVQQGRAAMAQRVMRDLQASGAPPEQVAACMVRAYTAHGLLEPALAAAAALLPTPPAYLMAEPDVTPAHPPLSYYAVCLYQAAQQERCRSDPAMRRRLLGLLDEFRLALAHAWVAQEDVAPFLVPAYCGALQLLLHAAHYDHHELAALDALWTEWLACVAEIRVPPEWVEIVERLQSEYKKLQDVPRPSADTTDKEP